MTWRGRVQELGVLWWWSQKHTAVALRVSKAVIYCSCLLSILPDPLHVRATNYTTFAFTLDRHLLAHHPRARVTIPIDEAHILDSTNRRQAGLKRGRTVRASLFTPHSTIVQPWRPYKSTGQARLHRNSWPTSSNSTRRRTLAATSTS